MLTALKIIFMGSPDFSVPALEALIDTGHRVVCVYTQSPRPAGRGQNQKPCPVHAFAIKEGLKVRTPKTLKTEVAQSAFENLNADVCIVSAYGVILPKGILKAPRLGCLNIHPSLLPRWRGAAPIQRAILAGDKKTGVTIMEMNEGLDTGDILQVEEVPITNKTTAFELQKTLSYLGAKLIVKTLTEELIGYPQSPIGVTYANKLDSAEGRLDWKSTAIELERRVRAFNPWPGVWFEHAGSRIKVLDAEVSELSGEAGTILDPQLNIACSVGALRLIRVQKQGRTEMAIDDFLRGHKLPIGAKLI